MSLSCSCENDDADWYYIPSDDFSTLATKRSRKCCSCGAKLVPGSEVLEFPRHRPPENEIEERIYGDEVPMPTWYMCETCGGLHFAVADLGMCYSLGENIAKQIREFREAEGAYLKRRREFHARMMQPNADVTGGRRSSGGQKC